MNTSELFLKTYLRLGNITPIMIYCNYELKNKYSGTKAADYSVPLDDDTIQVTAYMYNMVFDSSTDMQEVTISENILSHSFGNSPTTIDTKSKTYTYKIDNLMVSLKY
jgi:hypothetical protein